MSYKTDRALLPNRAEHDAFLELLKAERVRNEIKTGYRYREFRRQSNYYGIGVLWRDQPA